MAYVTHLIWITLLSFSKGIMPDDDLPDFELQSGEVLVPEDGPPPTWRAAAAAGAPLPPPMAVSMPDEPPEINSGDGGGGGSSSNSGGGGAKVGFEAQSVLLPPPRIVITIVPQLQSVAALKRLTASLRRAERPHEDIEVALVFWLDWAAKNSSSTQHLVDFVAEVAWDGPKAVRFGPPSLDKGHQLGYDDTNTWQLFNAWDHRFPEGMLAPSKPPNQSGARNFVMVINDNVDAVPRLYLKRAAPLLFAQLEAEASGTPLDAPLMGVSLLGQAPSAYVQQQQQQQRQQNLQLVHHDHFGWL